MLNTAADDRFEAALAALGVSTTSLTLKETTALDDQGWVILESLCSRDTLERLQRAFESVFADVGFSLGGRQSGTRHLGDLLRRDPSFEIALTNSRVLAAARHVLGRPFRVMQLGGRDPLPGYGQQGLHTDWLPRMPSDPFVVVTAIWLLDDFTPTNGATRLVPGSHRTPRPLPKSMQQPESRHPRQHLVIAPAGSALVFNGHLWHSGTRNDSSSPRRVLQCQFVLRGFRRPGASEIGVRAQMSPAVRYLVGS
jgi:Phytanoyl-CoA dioxygenase (PhyH)